MKEEEYILLTNLTKIRNAIAILRDTMTDQFFTDEIRKKSIALLAETLQKYETVELIDSSD